MNFRLMFFQSIDYPGTDISPTEKLSLGKGSHKSQTGDDFEGAEEAYQASLKGNHHPLFTAWEKEAPEKSRECFNTYF